MKLDLSETDEEWSRLARKMAEKVQAKFNVHEGN